MASGMASGISRRLVGTLLSGAAQHPQHTIGLLDQLAGHGACGLVARHHPHVRLGGAAAVLHRGMGTALKDVPPATLRKARRLALLVGAIAGGFGSLVGVGGGVLISPIIANSCKAIPQRVISGTSLAAVATTGAAAGAVYYSAGAVDLTSAALLAASATLLGPLGARATHMFNCAALRRFMAYWLFAVAPLVPAKPWIMKHYAGAAAAPPPPPPPTPAAAADAAAASTAASVAAGAAGQQQQQQQPRPEAGLWRPLAWPGDCVLVATGTLAGFASGLLGIGGGTIVTPLLTLATGLPQLSVLGTSLAGMVVPSLVALSQHARLGNVDWRMAAGLAAGTLAGGTLGGRVAVGMPEGVLEWVFCGGMLFLGWRTLLSAGPAKAAAGAGAGAGTGSLAAAKLKV